MNATRLTVSRILDLGVRVTWREAGAIAYEVFRLASERDAAGATSLAIDNIALTRGGEVVFLEDVGKPRAEAIVGLVAPLVAACDAPDRLGMALASGHVLTFIDELGERTSAKRRRVEIAAVALRGLAAEADREWAQPRWADAPAPTPTRTPPWERAVGTPFELGRRPSQPAVPPRQFTRTGMRAGAETAPIERPTRDFELFRGAASPEPAAADKPRRTWLWVIAAACLAAAVGFGLWLWTRSPAPQVTGSTSSRPALAGDRGTRPASLPAATAAVRRRVRRAAAGAA